jgi:hypothetical protein
MLKELYRSKAVIGFYALLVVISYVTYFSNSIARYLLWNAWSALPFVIKELLDRVLSVLFIRVIVFFELILLYTFIHRILGYIAGYLIRSEKDPEKTGKFNIHIEWISFRVGLDWNQVVIHGIEWRNPPGFINTPWLLRIEEVSVAIDVLSVFRAITIDTSIHIQSIFVRGIDLNIERYSPSEDPSQIGRLPDLKRGALNFNVATGAVDAPQERSVMERINSLLKGAMNDSTKFMEAFKNTALDPVSAIKNATDLVFAAKGGEDEMQALFLKHDKDGSGFLDKDELKALCRSTGAAVVDDEHLDHLFSILDSSGDGRITYEEFSLWWKNKDKRGIDLKEALSSDEESSKAIVDNKGAAKQEIPYKFEIDNLQISQLGKTNHNSALKSCLVCVLILILTLFLAVNVDFLFPVLRKEQRSYTLIRLPLFNMFRVDLTLPPDRAQTLKPGETRKRRGLYPDDLIPRIVIRLLKTLMYENSIAMLLAIPELALPDPCHPPTPSSTSTSTMGFTLPDLSKLIPPDPSHLFSPTASKSDASITTKGFSPPDPSKLIPSFFRSGNN